MSTITIVIVGLLVVATLFLISSVGRLYRKAGPTKPSSSTAPAPPASSPTAAPSSSRWSKPTAPSPSS